MANNYDINYEDSRFQQVETDKQAALNEVDKTYGDMIGQSDSYFQSQIDASKDWADKQTQLQNEKTEFAIDQIEQQKEQAKKDYTKEQSGAYVDWQKQSNQYGANAEKMASSGMTGTGFSESSQVSMYNTYQSRVTAARESYNLAVQNYNNSITEARLQNSSVLAEIAYQALQKQLELSLQGFQYKNTLILEQANKKTQLESEYYGRYQDVLQQINQENALAEEIRQYNESLAEEKRQFDAQMAQRSSSGGSGGSGGGGGGGTPIVKDDPVIEPDPEPAELTVANSPLTVNEAIERYDRGEIYVEQKGNKLYVTKNPEYVKGQEKLDKYTGLSSLSKIKMRTD